MAYHLTGGDERFYINGETITRRFHTLLRTTNRIEQDWTNFNFVDDLIVRDPRQEICDKIEILLNKSMTTKTFEICSRQSSIEINLVKAMASMLSRHRSLKRLIIEDSKDTILEKIKETLKIWADGINESSLKFLALFNFSEMAASFLYEELCINTTLKELYIANSSGLGSKLSRFALSCNLTKLHLVDNTLKDSDMTSLIDILQKTTSLETLELSQFHLLTFYTSFSDLCSSGLAQNRTLKKLIIGARVELEDEDNIKSLITSIKVHPTIEALKLTTIVSKSVELIAEQLLDNSGTIKSLSLAPYSDRRVRAGSFNRSDLAILSKMIATNTTLQHFHIDLSNEARDNEPCSSTFMNALKSNMTLLTLGCQLSFHLSAGNLNGQYSKFVDESGLVDYLRHNSTLKTLAIKRLKVTDSTTFFNAIFNHKGLTSLDISNMRSIECETDIIIFLKAFTNLIANTTTLKELKFSNLYFPGSKLQRTYEHIVPSLKANQSLTSIECITGGLSDEVDVEAVNDLFSVNKTLVKINNSLPDNKFLVPYLQINREYRLDTLIVLYNIVRSESSIFPAEIWRLIFQNIPVYSYAIDTIFNQKQ